MSGHTSPRDSPRWCNTCVAYGLHHTDRHPDDDLPIRVGAVVWTKGCPWVLDGEPGADRANRRLDRVWVGAPQEDGRRVPQTMTPDEMREYGYSLVWAGDDEGL